ncbi:uncharacterized protein LOC116294573 isoform X3 [Actinia tenebrosa]|uniref:Uncharacterized protein LOC116294573 isoform X3 n=1 Tax=Actinia tenebrosa TaxID=6105 RepID=A0A6P8HNY1_ACTTE|nr:uncharacterized protein LOC116294573 isoform X3 [Actinia tenebrosa]
MDKKQRNKQNIACVADVITSRSMLSHIKRTKEIIIEGTPSFHQPRKHIFKNIFAVVTRFAQPIWIRLAGSTCSSFLSLR